MVAELQNIASPSASVTARRQAHGSTWSLLCGSVVPSFGAATIESITHANNMVFCVTTTLIAVTNSEIAPSKEFCAYQNVHVFLQVMCSFMFQGFFMHNANDHTKSISVKFYECF
jgi:hypothetical protein